MPWRPLWVRWTNCCAALVRRNSGRKRPGEVAPPRRPEAISARAAVSSIAGQCPWPEREPAGPPAASTRAGRGATGVDAIRSARLLNQRRCCSRAHGS